MRKLEYSSALAVSATTLWAHAVSPAGVNRELAPWLRMTFPSGVEDITDVVPPGGRVHRCWLLLAGVLPVEYDDLAFEAVQPGAFFQESSSMLSQRSWRHRRSLEPIEGGTRITDSLVFESRMPLLEGLAQRLVQSTFSWRHRRLRRLFGCLADAARSAP